MNFSRKSDQRALENPSILLASDSERTGSNLRRILADHGFEIAYAGSYSQLEHQLDGGSFDLILLEVTGEHAVESAVETALRVKRADAGQFVGYIADPALDSSGLAGDGIFPRSATRLPEALRTFLTQPD